MSVAEAALSSGKISDVELRESRTALRQIALRALKSGNAEPFVRFHWPELIIRDKSELSAFKKHCTRKDWLDIRLDDFQVDMIKASFDRRHSQLFVSGGTKLGKGFCVGGIIVNIHFSLYKDSKIVLIGPDVEHVKRNLFAETLTWRRRMTDFKTGDERCECLTEKISDPESEQHFIIIANPKTGEGLSGIHSSHPLFVFDESSGQPDSRYTDSLSQCASGLLVCIGNPRQPSGFFYRAFKGFESGCKTMKSEAGPRRLVSIGLVDCINVRAERVAGIIAPPGGMAVDGVVLAEGELIPMELREKTKLLIPGQGCKLVCETLKRTVPADEIEWRVFGRFPKDAKMFSLFQSPWWEASIKKHAEIKNSLQFQALGIDVAASEHGDYCALAWGEARGCKQIDLLQNPNLMMLKGDIYHNAMEKGVELRGGYVPVAIDSMAMGQGLADAMELDGCYVIRIGGSSGPENNKEQYMNRRAEVYGDLAGALNPQSAHMAIWALPDDDLLREEMFALERIYLPNSRWKLNSKRKLDAASKVRNQDNRDSVMEKIGRSPDRSDSVAYLYAVVKLLPDFWEESVSQFDPSNYIRGYVDLGCGEFQVTLWDGKVEKMAKEAFREKFGSEPRMLQF